MYSAEDYWISCKQQILEAYCAAVHHQPEGTRYTSNNPLPHPVAATDHNPAPPSSMIVAAAPQAVE